jgi:hypothetical protein
MKRLALLVATLAGMVFLALVPGASSSGSIGTSLFECDEGGPLCAETVDPIGYAGAYTGHDEPSLLFYSGVAGSGNSQLYKLTIPAEPTNPPKQDGTGGTFNFQLHPAFWFGLALCDDSSGPNPGGSPIAGPQIPCTPDSDANIYDDPNSTDPFYIGKHPGTGFLELQFYPPGWVKWPPGISCDPSKWCAAMVLFQLNQNQNTGVANNSSCLNSVGIEPANFAFITRSGTPIGPPDPLGQTTETFTPTASKVMMFAAGDALTVDIHDSSAGLVTAISDLTSGQSGSMTASTANGFAHIDYAPSASTCTETPGAWHPSYSTSSEHTRVPWAAHSYNVAFSDEIGHFEYCNAVAGQGGACTQDGVGDLDNGLPAGAEDDFGCFAPPFQPPFQSTRVKIGGCIATDFDFDGVPYKTTWPGSLSNAAQDAAFNPKPIRFSSPLFNGNQAYDRVAFEADLPRIELNTNPPCNRSTGTNCVNPPVGATFYPIYSTTAAGGQCVWQLGGPYIPGTTNTFGGTSTAEYGPQLTSVYPGTAGPITRINNFRNVLSTNPC